MNSVVRWAIKNSPAMNILMVAILAVGAISLLNLRREVFPEFELEIVLVTVPYPGATPDEVEQGICQKIEEAVRSVDGIKKQTAVAQEGSGFMILELETGVNAQKILNEVRSEVDRIPSFPEKAEDAEVKQITIRSSAIRLGVIGPDSDDPTAELKLRDLTEKIRDELIHLTPEKLYTNKTLFEKIMGVIRPEKTGTLITQAEITGARPYQIDVEISEETLRRHNLTLRKAAEKIRRENMEVPGGTIKTDSQDIRVKGKAKAITGVGIADLPLVTLQGGVVLKVGDLGEVRDEFADVTSTTYINGKPGMIISVTRTAREDLLAVTDAVRTYAEQKEMPPGYKLAVFDDRSIDVMERMELLGTNGLQGLLLVLLTLALFLDTRLACWVAMGIPISILGACGVLLLCGQTLNMLSMFAFLMALGIVVDDAIVVGENIYAHRQRNVSFFRAAVDGTLEVLPSVVTSVTTTVIAFMPMLFVTGVMGKFFAVMPFAMIAMLIISLLESFTILPCHLGHGHPPHVKKSSLLRRALNFQGRLGGLTKWTLGSAVIVLALVFSFFLFPLKVLERLFGQISKGMNYLLEQFAGRIYLPALRFALKFPGVVLAAAFAVLLLTIGFVRGGAVPFIVFPKMDSKGLEATVKFPDGTPAWVTNKAVKRLEQAIVNIDKKYRREKNMPILKLRRRSVGYVTAQSGPGQTDSSSGSNIGSVAIELVDTSKRDVSSQQLTAEWRKEWSRLNPSGNFPGIESIKFQSAFGGPGGKAIEFRLLAPENKFAELEKAVEQTKDKLRSYSGVFDIDDDSQPGKAEYVFRIKDKARSMDISHGDLIQTISASYYGEEVMRLQRGRHEIKLMVRYPVNERKKLASLDQIRVRADDGAERPITELADKKVGRSFTEINRVDQMRSITVTADVDEAQGNAANIVQDLRTKYIPDLEKRYPWLELRWEGQQQQTVESMQSLGIGFLIALGSIYVILCLEFRSYLQPALIMFIIPFGMVGAVMGHYLLQLPLTLFSVLGLMALTGVVVNDSIVLIDFINHRVRAGIPLSDALLDAGRRRLRPVLLTSVTTVAGLMPLLLETSMQAQFLIPMAVSLSFGLMMTTVLVLFLLPTAYSVYGYLIPPKVDKDEYEMPPEVTEITDMSSDQKAIQHHEAEETPMMLAATNGEPAKGDKEGMFQEAAKH